jgi:hypothetical protein
MPASPFSLWLKVAAFAAFAPLALAQAPQTFTPKQIVQFAPGGDKERAGLSRLPGLADIVKGQFGIGAADLNGDGTAEMIVLSLVCDNAGCPVVVLQSAPGKVIAPIFVRKVAGRVAVTNEKVNGYYALAAADQSGAIMKDARGQQIVYTLGAVTPAGSAPGGASATPPQAAPKPAAGSSAAPPPTTAAGGARVAGGEFLPVCLLERCLNPRVTSKSGVGTTNAAADAAVTKDDATAWCAKFNKGNPTCVDDQVAQGGTAGGAKYRSNAFKATANCASGKLTAVDGRSYTYVGKWPDSGPGAGRPKFQGSAGEVGGRLFEQQDGPQVANGSMSIFQVALEPNAGESLAIQWELLCAGAAPPAH